jgi:O-antigen biosynthesis protein WbqV
MVINRASLVYLHDLFMAAFSFQAALFLRLGDHLFFQMPPEQVALGTLLFAVICAVVFRMMGLYQGVWRYASTRDMANIARAVTLAILVFLPLMFFVTRLESLPRSLPVLNWFVLAFLLGAPRFAYRLWRDRSLANVLDSGQKRIPVLLAGSGDAAETFIRATERSQQSEYTVVGLVSEKPQRVGMRIRHAPVLGTLEQLPEVLRRLKARGGARPRRLILTRDDMPRPLVRQLLEQTQAMGLTLARLPQMTELREGVEDAVKVRPIAIEDLLGRAQSTLDRGAMAGLIAGRRVLVTGAGGSIGSELVRQIAALGPATMTLVEASEFALYGIDMELSDSFPALARRSCLGDVRDRARLDDIFSQAAPELVVHAAALKHVPLVEANPLEGIRTNTLGTRNVGETCRRHGVSMMVMISTDKAVNPTNVMGATKRMAELYCQTADLIGRSGGGTRLVTVRFGNVLGSTGSVVPLFRKQLERGGPLTVTHPDMTRYFMTIREAVELVLQASALGANEDAFKGRIFVLDMGEPIKIADLARQMIRLAGFEPDKDIAITFSGLRPGEKLYEEIFHGAEPPVKTHHEGILIAAPRLVDQDTLEQALCQLERACGEANLDAAMAVLRQLVPEYGPQR